MARYYRSIIFFCALVSTSTSAHRRRGGWESSDPISYTRRFKPDIPEECKNLGICEEINNYPQDLVDSLIEQLDGDFSGLNMDQLDTPISQRIGGGGGENNIELCHFDVKLVAPQAAQAMDGEWHVILNQKNAPIQGFQVEVCQAESKCAENIASFYGGYSARCQQKFVQRVMTAVDVGNGQLIPDKSFRVPSCCSCVASRT